MTALDRAFAADWYANGWIAAWNENRPELIADILTEDFVLDSPTTRHTGWHVQGHQAVRDYLAYVLGAYPDLQWQITEPPMFDDTRPRAAFSWRGTGHFTGRLDPPGIEGPGEGSTSPGWRCSTSAATEPAISTRPTTCSA